MTDTMREIRLNSLLVSPPKIWYVPINQELFDQFRSSKSLALAKCINVTVDLTKASSYESFKQCVLQDPIIAKCKTTPGERPIGNLFSWMHEIKVGDLVVCSVDLLHGTIAMGRVMGSCVFRSKLTNTALRYQREIKWHMNFKHSMFSPFFLEQLCKSKNLVHEVVGDTHAVLLAMYLLSQTPAANSFKDLSQYFHPIAADFIQALYKAIMPKFPLSCYCERLFSSWDEPLTQGQDTLTLTHKLYTFVIGRNLQGATTLECNKNDDPTYACRLIVDGSSSDSGNSGAVSAASLAQIAAATPVLDSASATDSGLAASVSGSVPSAANFVAELARSLEPTSTSAFRAAQPLAELEDAAQPEDQLTSPAQPSCHPLSAPVRMPAATIATLTSPSAHPLKGGVMEKVLGELPNYSSDAVKAQAASESKARENKINVPSNIKQLSLQLIIQRMKQVFCGEQLTALVKELLKVQGYETVLIQNVLGGQFMVVSNSLLGLSQTNIGVMVYNGTYKLPMAVLDQLRGLERKFALDYALLVSWGGFASDIEAERAFNFLNFRLWDEQDLVNSYLNFYPQLSESLRHLVPLRRVWHLA